MRASSSEAARTTSGPVSTADGSVVDRVIVRKSWNRTLMLIVRAAMCGAAQAAGHGVGEPHQLVLQGVEAVVVAGEGLLVADRLRPLVRHDVAIVDAHRQPAQMRPVGGTQGRDGSPLVDARQLADRVDPEAVQLLEGLGADPPQRLHRQRVEEREDLAVVDDLDAEPWLRAVRSDAGLGRLGGQLGHELGGGHPHRAREALLVEARRP